MENLNFIHLMVGPLFLVIAILFKQYPPKNINGLYGYRTGSSMKSQERWDAANHYSADLMFRLGLILLLVQAGSVWFLKTETSLLVASFFLVAGLIGLVVMTEVYLRKKFGP
jgi:uncharacterized membrane protein